MEKPRVIGGQVCPICAKKTLTLTEGEKEVPYFGMVYIFSMDCSDCHYHKADVEPQAKGEPTRWVIEINCEEDMKIRVVKSSEATIKIPRIMTIESSPTSNGYVTNIEGILNRAKVMLEKVRDDAEDNDDRKKAKNMIKKLQDVIWGREPMKITIEDASGNSAIISDKAVKSKL
jgi:zinc finger protein